MSEQIEYKTNPVKAIRAKCLECSNFQKSEVEGCAVTQCPIYPFRLGKNPYRTKRELTEEQRKAAADRLAKARIAASLV